MADNNIEDLYYYLLLHGSNTDIEKLPLDERLKNYAKNISEMNYNQYNGKEIPYISELQLFQNVDHFMTSHFRLHPVGLVSDKELGKKLKHKKIKTPDDLVRFYNQSAKMVDPFCIPIDFQIDHIFGGRIIAQSIVTEDKSFYQEILPKLNLYFQKILLSKVLTSVAPTNYVHELTHTQLESQKGIIEDYYNGEFLSIFLEFVHSYETNPDVFTLDFANRLSHILVNFYSMFMHSVGHPNPDGEYTELNYYRDSKYIVSIVEAISLFQQYAAGDEITKKEIMKRIQDVFDGKMTVEDYLKKFGISYQESLDPEVPKRIIKQLF